MNGAGCRRKGANFERELAHRMESIFGEAKRGLSQTRDGSDCPDVVLPKGAPFWIEAKHRQRCNIKDALEQAQEALTKRAPDMKPLAITKDNGQTPVASMYLEDFEWLLRDWWRLHSEREEFARVVSEMDPLNKVKQPI